jgi:hypothetical protein
MRATSGGTSVDTPDQLNFAERQIYNEVKTVLQSNGIANKTELYTKITRSLLDGDPSPQVCLHYL